MNDRREFLKLFGAGCAIVPIIGGLPIQSAEVTLIESPRVRLADSPILFGNVKSGDIQMNGKYGITVIFEREDGMRRMLQGQTFITNAEQEMKAIRGFGEDIAFAGSRRVRWKLEGEFHANKAGEILTLSDFDS